MSPTDDTDPSVEAPHGSKMLRVSVRFWTDQTTSPTNPATSCPATPGQAASSSWSPTRATALHVPGRV
jgi:hypothetical protein